MLPILPSRRGFFFGPFKEHLQRPALDAGIADGAFHGVGLPTSGLSIGEDADVEAVDERLHERRHFREQLRLRRGGAEDTIQLECCLC